MPQFSEPDQLIATLPPKLQYSARSDKTLRSLLKENGILASKIKALTWIADPHLEFLEENAIVDFAKRIENHPADAVLVTGDICDARRLALALVPPFAGAAWHEGCISTPDFLPL